MPYIEYHTEIAKILDLNAILFLLKKMKHEITLLFLS